MSSSRSASGTAKPGSLTNVVQSLVRAQYGLTARESTNSGASTPGGSGSKAGGETETDLDRHVAELLLKEAKEREERAKKENVGYWRLSDDEGYARLAAFSDSKLTRTEQRAAVPEQDKQAIPEDDHPKRRGAQQAAHPTRGPEPQRRARRYTRS